MKTAACLASVAFLAWTLPLGAFIRPSAETHACGGKRAFHMCAPAAAQVGTRAAGPAFEAPAPSAEAKAPASSQGGIELPGTPSDRPSPRMRSSVPPWAPSPASFHRSPLEAVPKAS